MCLTIKDTKPKIAEEDITCYKVMFMYVDKDNPEYRTPFQKTPMLPNKKYTDKKEWEVGYSETEGKKELIVSGGGFHTLKDHNQTRNFMFTTVYICGPYLPVLFETIIPKGTEYYEGNFDKVYDSYCSKQIILTDTYETYNWSGDCCWNTYVAKVPDDLTIFNPRMIIEDIHK